MKRLGLLVLALGAVLSPAYASLIGPWFRYECQELGFRIPVASGWRVTRVPNGIVFAMQSNPNPYVRVAVGRLPANQGGLDHVLAKANRVRKLRVDGLDAFQ